MNREVSRSFPKSPGGLGWAAAALALLVLLAAAGSAWARTGQTQVRRLGVSRVGDTTLLTVVLSKGAEARVTPQSVGGSSLLVVEFPQALGQRLPSRLAGDDLLVRQVKTETLAGGKGVRITLEIAPNRPYTFWKRTSPLAGGQTAFLVGLKAEAAAPAQAQVLPPGALGESPPPQPQAEPQDQYAQTRPEYQWGGGAEAGSGRLAEVRRLIPRAQSLWNFLESGGWSVSEDQEYDRPGQRYSRGLILTNSQFPELSVKVAYIPSVTAGAPHIGMVTLSFDQLRGDTADKYRQMRKMTFSQIKGKFDDIGDFFDDALKPLRVDLRKQCQQLATRWTPFLRQYAQHAALGNTQVAEKIMGHLKEKVNQRFEGVQYTVSEDPLMLLNLVDFLYLRSYYLSGSTGG